MMVHSFDPRNAGLSDFQGFAVAAGFESSDATRLVGPISCGSIDLYLGWTADRPGSEGFRIVDGRKSDAEFFDD